MNESLTEAVVERFHRTRRYLVERAVPIVAENEPQFWSDLDVLAIKGDVVLVNCKDFVSDPRQKEKIAHNLDVAETWVRQNYSDLVTNKPITKQLVYGGSDKASIKFLQDKGIKCVHLGEMLAEYLVYLASNMDSLNEERYSPPKGKRWYRIGNLTGYDKVFVYLMNQKFLKVTDGQVAKWEG